MKYQSKPEYIDETVVSIKAETEAKIMSIKSNKFSKTQVQRKRQQDSRWMLNVWGPTGSHWQKTLKGQKNTLTDHT